MGFNVGYSVGRSVSKGEGDSVLTLGIFVGALDSGGVVGKSVTGLSVGKEVGANPGKLDGC